MGRPAGARKGGRYGFAVAPERCIPSVTSHCHWLVMNAPSELNHEEVLRLRLEVLRGEHRDLDAAITAMQAAAPVDQLALRRLKKRKLRLKDQIAHIEDQLYPDIIA